MNNVEEIYYQLVAKYKKSRNIFVALNVASLFLAAAIIVLNLFAIRFNPVKHSDFHSYTFEEAAIMGLFIGLAILSAVAGLFTSIISFFVFRKRAKKDKEKVEAIKAQVKMYNNKKDAYSDKDRDKHLIEKVSKIRNS